MSSSKMIEAYPVHPFLFDKLASEWGGLDKFQRTRGVLALLARTIYASYRDRSDEPLILPSSLRMNDPEVRGALMEPLEGPVWGSIIDSEVDGDTSLPVKIEMNRARYRNEQIVRRAARSVFVGTAPRGEARGGLTGPELRFSCANPGEQVSVFGDALRELAERASHLHEAEGRYWFSPHATLGRLADNRAADIDADRVDAEIVALLKEDERQDRSKWGRVHVAPSPPQDVVDEPVTRLVVLGPGTPYSTGGGSLAEAAALEAVTRKTGGQRRFRNALVVVAADQKALEEVRRATRRMLAWRDISGDQRLDLRDSQRTEARESAEAARKGAVQAVRKAWSHLLAPERSVKDAASIEIQRSGIKVSGQDSVPKAAWHKAAEEHTVLEQLGRASLLDCLKKLWAGERDDLELDALRDWFFEFPYMERLRDEQVLADTVSAAVADISDEGLGLAQGKDATGGYVGLQFRRSVEPRFGVGALLVRNGAAKRTAVEGHGAAGDTKADDTSGKPAGEQVKVGERPKRFVGVVQLDSLRGLAKAGQIFESVVHELDRASGTKFRITLEIQAEASEGFPEDVEAVVADNASTLGFSDKRFD